MGTCTYMYKYAPIRTRRTRLTRIYARTRETRDGHRRLRTTTGQGSATTLPTPTTTSARGHTHYVARGFPTLPPSTGFAYQPASSPSVAGGIGIEMITQLCNLITLVTYYYLSIANVIRPTKIKETFFFFFLTPVDRRKFTKN